MHAAGPLAQATRDPKPLIALYYNRSGVLLAGALRMEEFSAVEALSGGRQTEKSIRRVENDDSRSAAELQSDEKAAVHAAVVSYLRFPPQAASADVAHSSQVGPQAVPPYIFDPQYLKKLCFSRRGNPSINMQNGGTMTSLAWSPGRSVTLRFQDRRLKTHRMDGR